MNAETEAASRESQDELKETQTILNNQRQKHLALREELKQLKQKLAGVEDERDQIERRVAQHKQTASKKTKVDSFCLLLFICLQRSSSVL